MGSNINRNSKESAILISVVSPVFEAEVLLETLVESVIGSVSTITDRFEIILVDDRSPDGSWEQIKRLHSRYRGVVKGIRLSRNFGQQAAITAGFEASRGEWVVVMDCDMQDNPDEIPKLFKKAQEGFDIVLASRRNRKDHFLKRFFSKCFYSFLSYLTDIKQDGTVANFAVCHSRTINALLRIKDYHRYFPTMIRWIGFNWTTIQIEHCCRGDQRKSSYTLKKRFRLAMDTILSSSDKPLRMTIKLGLIILLSASLIAGYLIVRYFMDSVTVSGWTSIFLSVWALSGLIISVMGMIGLYIGRIFEETKSRPVYIVDEEIK